MKIVFLDVETSKKPVMHPWQHGSFLCSVGMAVGDGPVRTWLLKHQSERVELFSKAAKEMREFVRDADLIVAHNAKFDLNWMKTIGITFPQSKIWCTQVVDYLLNGQYKLKYGLNFLCNRYNLDHKLDAMHQYWEDGYETDEIPADIHLEYLKQDVELVRKVYNIQAERVKLSELTKLVELTCEVTDILSDMECLGFTFDKEQAERELGLLGIKLKAYDMELKQRANMDFNPGSSEQLSTLLYGGKTKTEERETYHVTLKSGVVKEKSRKVTVVRYVPGMGFKPLDGTESDTKEGVFSTDKKTLSLLVAKTKEQKEFLRLLIERSKINKMITSFCSKSGDSGLINIIGIDGRIHPSYNQTVVITGRLSSSNPEYTLGL